MSDIALKEISVGIYFIKDISVSVLRKARGLRLLGSTVNYTQGGSYGNCTSITIDISNFNLNLQVGHAFT